MMGFVYKDFLLLRNQLWYCLALVGLYTFFAISGITDASILSGAVVVLGFALPINAFSYDHQARWDKFAAATPAGRRGMVAGRYLLTLLILLGSAVFSTALMALLSLTGLTDQELSVILFTVPPVTAIALLANAVLLPLLYKFGVEKARIMLIVFFATLALCAAGVGYVFYSFFDLSVLSDLSSATLGLVIAGLFVGALALFGLSYLISQRIFAKKEL